MVKFFRHFFWGVCDSKGCRKFKHLRYISSYTRVFTVYDAFLKKEENVNSYVRTKTSASGRPLVTITYPTLGTQILEIPDLNASVVRGGG